MSFSDITKEFHNTFSELLILYKNLKNENNNIEIIMYYNLLNNNLISSNCYQIKSNFNTAELLYNQGSLPILKVIINVTLSEDFNLKFIDNGSIFKNICLNYDTYFNNIKLYKKYIQNKNHDVNNSINIISNNKNKLLNYFNNNFIYEYKSLLKYLYNIDYMY